MKRGAGATPHNKMGCWRLECWSNNSANSHLSPGPFNRRALCSCLVPQCSHPPYRPRHQRRLANCDLMPAPYTSGQPSNPRRHPTCWASLRWSHSAPLSAHPSIECERTAPPIETPICTSRTTSHQFIWQQQHRCGAVGESPMECGVDGQPHKTPHFHPRHRHPPIPEWPSQEEAGSGLTASAPGSGVSSPACTNGVWLLCGLWVWRRRTNRRPCCPPMSNPSTSLWTARPDGSRRSDNRMFAQHLPRNLTWPRCG